MGILLKSCVVIETFAHDEEGYLPSVEESSEEPWEADPQARATENLGLFTFWL
jgi:hypothetical protein